MNCAASRTTRLLLGVVAAAALSWPTTGCDEGICFDGCLVGQTNYGCQCANLQTDVDNCGKCGHVCGEGECCNEGLCRTDCTLPPHMRSCSGLLVDIRTDPNNCGDCGVPCDIAAGFICNAGKCSCFGGKTSCGIKCVDTQTDPKNCGKCGNECADDESCLYGNCVKKEDAGVDAGLDIGVDAGSDLEWDAGRSPDAAADPDIAFDDSLVDQ